MARDVDHQERRDVGILILRAHSAYQSLACRISRGQLFPFYNPSTRDKSNKILARQTLRASDEFINMNSGFGYQSPLNGKRRSVDGEVSAITDVRYKDPREVLDPYIDHNKWGCNVFSCLRTDRQKPGAVKQVRQQFYRVRVG